MAERTVAVRLLALTSPYVAGMQRAAAATRAAAAQTAAMGGELARSGKAMGNVAASAGLLRGGLVNPVTAAGAAVAGVTKAAIDWESAWAGVTKTVDGTDAQMKALQGDLRGMAKELPATHGEIAAVAEAAGQLGVATPDVAEFSRTMIDLGETTNLTADQAATSIARITNVMGTAQSDVDNFGSSLVDLGNNSATTEAEITEMAQRIAGAGSTIGLTEQEVLGFAAALSSVGIRAEAGGTAISRVMVDMSSAVEAGGEDLQGFADVAGMSAQQFATAFQEDPAAAIQTFVAGLGRISKSGGDVFATLDRLGLGEVRVRDALLRMAESGDVLSDSIEISNEAWAENTALAEEAANRYETTAASMQMSWNQIRDAAIDAGEVIAPVVEGITSGVADLVGVLQAGNDKMREMQDISSRVVEGRQPGMTEHIRDEVTGAHPFASVGQDIEDIGKIFSGESGPWIGNIPVGLITGMDHTAAASSADAAATATERYDAEIAGLQSRVPEATAVLEDFTRQTIDAALETRTGTERLAAYQDQMRSVTDPVFAMQQALIDVDEAQEAYNEAVAEYGADSDEARAASLGLAQAVAGAEQAALDGELSFDAFDAKLRRWVEQGVVTAAQADNIRERVKELRGEAEDYEGTYTAQMEAGGASKAEAEINGLINRAKEWANSTFTASVRVAGSGSRFVDVVHTGGEVTSTGDIRRFHGGGLVDSTIPRFHAGVSRLASDEVPAILQRGEMVFSAEQADHLRRAMAPIARSPMGGGSAATAAQAAQIVIHNMELKAVGAPFNTAEVEAKLEKHRARSGAA